MLILLLVSVLYLYEKLIFNIFGRLPFGKLFRNIQPQNLSQLKGL